MSQKPLVVVTDHLAEAGVEKPVLDGIADILLLQTGHERVVQERGTGADILLVFHDIKLSAATLDLLPRCKALIRCGVGIDNVDLQAAGRNGIVVCNVPDYGTEEVADHALMMLLAIARRLVPGHEAIRAGNWDVTVAFGTPRLRGKTLGLVGCGRIGTAMARRGLALGMRVVFHDPGLPDGVDKALGIERVYSLEELLPQAEFLSLHCPLDPSTRHLLNPRTLALLPRGAYVVNTARGPVIDGKAPSRGPGFGAGGLRRAGRGGTRAARRRGDARPPAPAAHPRTPRSTRWRRSTRCASRARWRPGASSAASRCATR